MSKLLGRIVSRGDKTGIFVPTEGLPSGVYDVYEHDKNSNFKFLGTKISVKCMGNSYLEVEDPVKYMNCSLMILEREFPYSSATQDELRQARLLT